MSDFVLNRQYGLELPTSYVDIDNEEMEYVDGGSAGLLTAGIGTIAGLIGGGYSGYVASQYVGAYNDCENLRKDYGNYAKVRVRTITLFGLITSVSCVRV